MPTSERDQISERLAAARPAFRRRRPYKPPMRLSKVAGQNLENGSIEFAVSRFTQAKE